MIASTVPSSLPDVPPAFPACVAAQLRTRLPRAVEGHSYLAFLGRFFHETFRVGERPVTVGLKVKHGGAAAVPEGGANASH